MKYKKKVSISNLARLGGISSLKNTKQQQQDQDQ